MSEFEIVKAGSADVAGMRECARLSYQHYIERIGKEPGPMLDDYEARVLHDHAFVIHNHGKVVALLVLIEEPEGLLLDNVAVIPDQQGAGLGKKLMTFAENQARSLGYSEMNLYTHIAMVESFELYKKLGYLETERKTVNGYQRIYMRKTL